MSWVRGLDGCWRWSAPVDVARWKVWRLAHPGWHAPIRMVVEAGIACGAPATLAAALALGPDAAFWRVQPAATESVRGVTLHPLIPTPPGEARMVGGTFELGRTSPFDPAAFAGVVPVTPVPVPEPGSAWVLAVGALLAVLVRKR